MARQRLPAVAALGLAAAALGMLAGDVLARGGYQKPPAQETTPTRPTSDKLSAPSNAPRFVPAGVPLDRTYTWYSPPAGYRILWEATPSQPRLVTIVGPDGRARTFRLVGPVVLRPHYYQDK
jgi:hypothetical protein